MNQHDLTSTVKKLKNLANQIDRANRGQDYFSPPSQQVNQIREIAVDLCLLTSLECSLQNGFHMIARLQEHGEALESISRELPKTQHQDQIRKIVFELIEKTPAIMSEMVYTLPDHIAVSCDINNS